MKANVVARLREIGIIPIIRSATDVALPVAEALVQAGLPVVEVTLTVPNAIGAIATIARRFGDKILVGAGTVTDAAAVQQAVDAGAEFIVTPGLVPEVIEAAQRASVVVLPGALTPTEIFAAARAGADMVKVFPIQSVGGAAYLRALRGPFPAIPLVPTGGVSLDNLAALFAAGAAAVGVGSELIPKDALTRGDYTTITVLAKRFLATRPT